MSSAPPSAGAPGPRVPPARKPSELRTGLHRLAYYLETFGCQMNENDSERISGLLAATGARPAARLEEADLVVVNTCAVRQKSEDKLYSYLGRLRKLKERRPLVVAVAGCVAQIRGEELFKKNPAVDLVLGPDNYHRLPEILAAGPEPGVVLTGAAPDWREAERRPALRASPVSAYVTIMEGCDNFCAYCIVPFARGREKCRPMEAVLDEVKTLAAAGYREIVFLGQNVNSYRDPETGAGFAALLRAANGVDGLEWIRFLTSHPKDFGEVIAAAMAESKRVCRQLHLPLQSGSSAVLAGMRRRYSREDALAKIALLRELMPGIHLSTDIIVGFPGETEAEFEATLSLLESVRFSNIFSFRYSPRPGTAAASLADDVPLDVKRRRLAEVQERQKRIQIEIHRGLVGATLPVLATGASKKDEATMSGRSEGNQVVNFSAPAGALGRFVLVRITDCGPYSLRGEFVRFL